MSEGEGSTQAHLGDGILGRGLALEAKRGFGEFGLESFIIFG